jgi:hypothetical protein
MSLKVDQLCLPLATIWSHPRVGCLLNATSACSEWIELVRMARKIASRYMTCQHVTVAGKKY